VIGLAGYAASALAFWAAVLGAVAGLREARVPRAAPRAARPARHAPAARSSPSALLAGIALTGVALAAGLMIVALVGHDFSVAYVAQVGSRATPLLYTIASLWAALEGSILLWALLLAGYTALFALRAGGPVAPLRPAALAVLLATLAVFLLVVVGPGNPWARVDPVPLDGPGPNPLLRNHPLMAIHPPILYTGLVGMAVPFALTTAALGARRLDAAWLAAVRTWTRGAWVFLTAGLLLGAWWSYAVLGWGGYWGWDPVEDVALLPWLSAAAIVHLARPEVESPNRSRWIAGLSIATFALTIFATLVTRSGLLDSVHAFSESTIGPLFLAFLGVVLVVSIAFATLRLPDAVARPVPPPARERGLVLGALAFLGILVVVLAGTLYPVVVDAVSGSRSSVGGPFFERFVAPLGAAIALLAGAVPLLGRHGLDESGRRRLVAPTAAAAVGATIGLVGAQPPEAVAGLAAGAFVLGGAVRALAARVGNAGRIRLPGRRRLGGLVAHLGFGIAVLAIVLSRSGIRETTATLAAGETTTVLGRAVTYVETTTLPGADGSIVRATIRLGGADPGAAGATVLPELVLPTGSNGAIPTPGIELGPAEDVYVTLLGLDDATGAATIRFGIHPFVSWLWIGGFIAVAGAALAAWPTRRRASAPAAAVARLAAEPG
jgi:cytochrome c-type biogenesis protein CcmF